MVKHKNHLLYDSNGMQKSPARLAFEVFNVLLLTGMAFLCLMPMLHVLFASVSDPNWLNSNRGIVWWPHGFNIEGYKLVFENVQLIRGFFNTVLYVLLYLFFGLVLSLTGGYVLAKKDVLWRDPIMFLISFTMLFHGGTIPTFINLKNLHMLDTIWSVVLPGSLSVMNLILIRTAFSTVPESLLESARLDGASEMRILWSISMPLIKATIATVSLYLVIGMWNSWFPAAMYLTDRSLYPMQLVLREILIVNQDASISAEAMVALEGSEANLYNQLVKYSTIIVSSAPMLILYPFIMKYFKSGIRVGAIKG